MGPTDERIASTALLFAGICAQYLFRSASEENKGGLKGLFLEEPPEGGREDERARESVQSVPPGAGRGGGEEEREKRRA
eukprot:12409520-Karenia_brevis.AAC.1